MTTPRFDVLLYCHDGRGHGHVSRTAAIALAIRRLNPKLRLLILTGSQSLPDLLPGNQHIDWIKLPSFRSVVVAGRSLRDRGTSGFGHTELVDLRRHLIGDTFHRLRPRCVLVDHLPWGKDGELSEAILSSTSSDTKWILGLRSIPGDIEELWSLTARDCVNNFFKAVFWYGCTDIYGPAPLHAMEQHFRTPISATGLVSRARELTSLHTHERLPELGGTIALSWRDLESERTLRSIRESAPWTQTPGSNWRLFLGPSRSRRPSRPSSIAWPSNVLASSFSSQYIPSLARSQIGITYAGYNCITDL